jgi:hypothetical protein
MRLRKNQGDSGRWRGSDGIPTLERGNENELNSEKITMRFPYGIADFRKIREEGYFYVDRTDRIPLLEEAGSQLLFLRPRRFGKSLWLSTLENYYDLARADDFDRLFGGLKIHRNPTPLRNRYFVMRWDFSVVDPSGDPNAIRRSLFNRVNVRIKDAIARYGDWLDGRVGLNPDDGLTSAARGTLVNRALDSADPLAGNRSSCSPTPWYASTDSKGRRFKAPLV